LRIDNNFEDFMMAEEIIRKSEKLKAKKLQKQGASSSGGTSKILALSDVLEGYKKVMRKHGIHLANENLYYAMMVKLSLNQNGKTWREALN
jgi:hypothetical protein